MASAPAAEVAPVVLAGGSYAVPVDGFSEPLLLAAEDVIVTQTPRAGWAVATGGGETVAIDTTVSAELQREGLAREFVRLVADARKNDGLDVTDRIWLRWSADDPEMAAALTEHAEFISGEVLAVDFGPVGGGGLDLGAAGALAEAAREHVEDGYGLRFWLGRA